MPRPDDVLPADPPAGYHRFRDTRYSVERERYRQLEEDGQRPQTMVGEGGPPDARRPADESDTLREP